MSSDNSGTEILKLFSCSTEMSMKFIMLINVEMSRIVGILIFMRMINTTSESLNARKVIIFQHFSFYEQLKFHSCMGICYAKLFEAAKSMFKSRDSCAVLTWLLLEKA